MVLELGVLIFVENTSFLWAECVLWEMSEMFLVNSLQGSAAVRKRNWKVYQIFASWNMHMVRLFECYESIQFTLAVWTFQSNNRIDCLWHSQWSKPACCQLMIKAHTQLSWWRWGRCFVLENCPSPRAHTVSIHSPGPAVAAPVPSSTQVQHPTTIWAMALIQSSLPSEKWLLCLHL